jgi:uncharacterized protein (TIGR00297 family)
MSEQLRDGDGLRWQSWLLLAAVTPWCALATLRHAAAAWTAHTQAGLGISLGLAFLVWLARAATPPAALTGGLITAVLASWSHFALLPLLSLFLLTFSATRFGRGKKQHLGVAEGKSGRNAAQVAANLGVAGLCAAAALSYPLPGSFYAVGLVAALAEASADTVASELGEVLGGQPLLITTLRRVPPGTDGAISLVGTLAGATGAGVVVFVAMVSLRLSLGTTLSAGLGAFAGLFVDSLLGVVAERRGWLNNDAVNFLSTLAAAVIATVLLTINP